MFLLTKASAKEAKKCRVTKRDLLDAIRRACNGSIDAKLGATFIKQAVARPPEGRKTACRAIIAFTRGRVDLSVVLHVYAKRDKANLSPRETDAMRDLSRQVLNLSRDQIADLVRTRGWEEIEDDGQE